MIVVTLSEVEVQCFKIQEDRASTTLSLTATKIRHW